MSKEQIPLCTIKMNDKEFSHIGFHDNMPFEDIIHQLVGADCWAVTVVKNSVVTVKMNTYPLYEKIGFCFNEDNPKFIPNPQFLKEEKWRLTIIEKPSLLSELKNIGDNINIYMFGSESWKVRIIKTKDGHKYDGFKSVLNVFRTLEN